MEVELPEIGKWLTHRAFFNGSTNNKQKLNSILFVWEHIVGDKKFGKHV